MPGWSFCFTSWAITMGTGLNQSNLMIAALFDTTQYNTIESV